MRVDSCGFAVVVIFLPSSNRLDDCSHNFFSLFAVLVIT